MALFFFDSCLHQESASPLIITFRGCQRSGTYEIIISRKPTISHLQPFGAKCYVHIPKESRPSGSKLLPGAVKGMFIGYTNSTKIFQIYIQRNTKLSDLVMSTSHIMMLLSQKGLYLQSNPALYHLYLHSGLLGRRLGRCPGSYYLGHYYSLI